MGRSGALLALVVGLAALLVLPVQPAITTSAPAPPQSSCVACHTSRAALEPLVEPLPVIPAEGEG